MSPTIPTNAYTRNLYTPWDSSMTPISLVHFLEALCWAALIFVAITGYGAIGLRIWRLRGIPIPLAGVTGLGIVVFLGGCLNLLHAISRPVLLVLLVLGVLGFVVIRPVLAAPTANKFPSFEPRATSLWTRPVLFLAALVFVIRFGASVHTQYYQHGDDYNFYLAAPVKMSELHQYAPDPFSERRIMSSLGGNYFLQSLLLTELPIEDIQMADRALGLLLLVFVAAGLGSVFRLTPLQRALLGLFLLITPQLQFNLTFVVLPYALFCGLVYLAADADELQPFPILHALSARSRRGDHRIVQVHLPSPRRPFLRLHWPLARSPPRPQGRLAHRPVRDPGLSDSAPSLDDRQPYRLRHMVLSAARQRLPIQRLRTLPSAIGR